jgi:hypothetical protein
VTSPFNSLVQEAIEVSRKLDALRRFPACKLTAEAYLAETLAADPTASLKGVAKLARELEKKHANLAHTSRTLARMIAGLRGPNFPTPPQAKYLGRLTTAFSTPETTAELIRHNSSTIELYGLAIQLVSGSNPEVWGTCESSAKHAQQVAALEARQAELFKELESKVSGDDLNIDAEDRNKPVTFKVAPDVPLVPKHDASQRLITYLMQQREQQGT